MKQEEIQSIFKKGDLNEETLFLKSVQRYIRYQLGKTSHNSHKPLKPEILQQDMIMIILHAIANETK